MPSQNASIRDLEDFATIPNLVNLTAKLNLEGPYLLGEPDFERAPLKTITSSGPVRLSTFYEELLHSAQALLVLWPSLERIAWTDKDPGRTRLADFFNSEALHFSRELLYGSPQEDTQSSAIQRADDMESTFGRIMEDLKEIGPDSDSTSDSDSEEFNTL